MDSGGLDLSYLQARPQREACVPAVPSHVPAALPARLSQELVAIQAGGPREIGFFGTRNMGFLHQQLIEILSYAMVLTVRPPRRLASAAWLANSPAVARRRTTYTRPGRRERTRQSSGGR